jgi:hypothetical protein
MMGVFVVAFYLVCRAWPPMEDGLLDVSAFIVRPLAIPLLLSLLGIAIAGGMFVVPLYAFLTTFVEKSQTARTIAANNIVNSGAMVIGSLVAMALSAFGLPLQEQVLLSAAMCVISALLGAQLYRSERAALA